MSVGAERKRVTKAPEERRQDILDAAVKVFGEKGITRTTVSDIVGAAGVAKGTFYLYLNSKEELLGALKERFVDEILDHTASFVERVGREDWRRARGRSTRSSRPGSAPGSRPAPSGPAIPS